MKKIICFLLICFSVDMLQAEYVALDSLRLTENFTFKQKAILHEVKVPNAVVDSTTMVEFVHNGTLYIMSSVFIQDYNEYMREFPDVPSLIQKIMSICPTECRNGDCGYSFTYDSDLPSTLTIYTFPNMDTIQYVTTHSPELHVAVIRDTIFCSSNIRCGVSIKDLFKKLFVGLLYYNNYVKYRSIVFIPTEFDNRAYQKKGYMSLPNVCFVIENKNGIISKIEIRQIDFFSKKKIIQDFELY